MKEPKEFTVDGKAYVVSPFPTSHGLKLLIRIFKMLGTPIVSLVFSAKDVLKAASAGGASALMDADLKDLDDEKIVSVIADFASKLEPEDVDDLFKTILRGTLLSGSSSSAADDYETRFMGNYSHLFKVIFRSLEGQYGDFLGALGGLAGLGRKASGAK